MSFGERLRAARAMAGLSLEELADRIGKRVTKQALSKYEKGLMKPESTTLVALSEALQVPVDYFFAESIPELTAWHFRKRAGMSAKSSKSLLETVRDRLQRYQELEQLLGVGREFRSPLPGARLGSRGQSERAAGKLRDAWGIGPDQPVASVAGLLEANGVKIIDVAGYEHFDGMAGYVADQPFIAISAGLPKDRLRFTLLHELAHVLLWPIGHRDQKDEEKLCHLFVSEFLLPGRVLRQQLSGQPRRTLAIPELLQMKLKYGISMQATLFCAHDLGILSDSGYEALLRGFGARGWRKVEPGDYRGTERPMEFNRLLYRAIAEDAISLSKAAALSLQSLAEVEAQLRGEHADRD